MELAIKVFTYALFVGSLFLPSIANSANTTVPQSALVPTTSLYTTDYGSATLARNDDGSTGNIPLGFSFSIFGSSYNSVYINNNGNLTVSGPLSTYIPFGPAASPFPIIAAWFADVDTRGALSGLVHYQQNVANQLVVTWDNVGRFAARDDLLATFQIVLRGDNYAVPTGEGTIGFFWTSMPWETTDTSQVASIGFGDGAGNSVTLEGSLQPGLNTAVQNHYIWFNQNLTPVPPTPPTAVPGPIAGAGLPALLGLAGAWFVRRRRALAG